MWLDRLMVRLDLIKDIWKIKREYRNRLDRGIRKALIVLMAELKALTPEDTKEMLNAYRIKGISMEGDNVVGTISNDSWHAIIVEFGVSGLTYNYHKPKWNKFYSGVGNRTFARAIDNKRGEILQIIARELW